MGKEEDFSLDEFFLMYEYKLEDMLFFSNGFRTEIKSLLAALNKYTQSSFSCILYNNNRLFDFYCENEKLYLNKFRKLVNECADSLNESNTNLKTKLGIIHFFSMDENMKLIVLSHSFLEDPKARGYINETIDSIIQLVAKTISYYQQDYSISSSSPTNNSNGSPAELSLVIKKFK